MAWKSEADWEAIEREYRAGQLSVSEIARQYGLSHTAINKRAKRDGWQRDLAEKVRREVSNRLVSSEVSAPVSSCNVQEAIDVAAERGVSVVRQHRATLRRLNGVIDRFLGELEAVTENAREIEDAIEEETAGDRSGKRRKMMMDAVSLPGRAETARTLAQATRAVIPLERQAFSLDDKTEQNGLSGLADEVEEAWKRLNKAKKDE